MKYLIILILLSSCASEVRRIDNRVNNMIEYKFDDVDYWQTPEETLNLKTGDCEDYAILKWQMMVDAGINSDDIYFIMIYFPEIDSYHLMLEYNGKYYDSAMKNRGRYNKDFVLIEKFTANDKRLTKLRE